MPIAPRLYSSILIYLEKCNAASHLKHNSLNFSLQYLDLGIALRSISRQIALIIDCEVLNATSRTQLTRSRPCR